MTEMLNKWLKNRENLFSASDIKTVDIRENNGQSMTIIQESEKYISDITVRNDGFIDIEIISIVTEEPVFSIHFMAKTKTEIEPLLDFYIDCMNKGD